jgi:hypothetical protein
MNAELDALSSPNIEVSPDSARSGPISGVVNPGLFREGGGAGYSVRADEREVRIAFAPDTAAKIVRFSPEAVWFEPLRALRGSIGRSVTFSLVWEDVTIGPLTGRLSRTGDEGSYLGVRFERVSIADARRLLALLSDLLKSGVAEPMSNPPPVQEDIADPKRIRTIMSALATAGNKGLLHSARGPVQMSVDGVDAQSAAVIWAVADDVAIGEGPHAVEMSGYNSVYRLEIPRVERRDGRLVTSMPTRVRRVRRRWFRRAEVQESLRVAFDHPVWRSLPRVEREVRDISFGGLCFTTVVDDDLAFPGMVIPALLVTDADGREIYLRGVVRSVVPAQGDEAAICGVAVTPCSPEDEGPWARLVTRLLYPSTRTSEEHTETLWELFEDSGYMSLDGHTPEQFEAIRQSFIRVSQHAAPHLISQTVWPSPRGVEASVSFFKPYSKSWMGHQLAKRGGKPPAGVPDAGQILKDLYLRAFEHPQSDPGFSWMIGVVETTVPWMDRTHVDFARMHMASGRALVLPMRMMHVDCDDAPAVANDLFETGFATAAERQLIAGAIAAKYPACYVDSLDLDAERLPLGETQDAWRQAGFERERAILVARRDGRAILAMVVELGETGTNLFRLLDSARFYALADDGADALDALLDAARRWYRDRGRDGFILYREDEGWSKAEGARPCFWVIAADLLPDFLEHVCQMVEKKRFSA